LYFFSNDAGATSTCTGGCIVTWPVFSTNNLTTDADLDKSDFSSILRTDGAKQLTYKGWPLYYYQPDSLKPGVFKGDAVGNVWFVAKPDYTIMIAKGQLVGNDGVNYDSTYKAGTQKYAYFTDDFGRTLYSFTPDKNRKNNYTKSDFSNDATWPIYQVSPLNVPSIVNKALLDTIHVFGKVQLTFKGWPLYHFGPDNSVRGSTKGVSVPTPGVWPVMNQFSPTAPL
jgi:predicted lipoprotein with Yx(FWY)xxD motif